MTAALEQIYDNLESFASAKLLKQGVFMFLANFFDLRREKRFLMRYFNCLDMDNSGELSFEELAASYCFKVR